MHIAFPAHADYMPHVTVITLTAVEDYTQHHAIVSAVFGLTLIAPSYGLQQRSAFMV